MDSGTFPDITYTGNMASVLFLRFQCLKFDEFSFLRSRNVMLGDSPMQSIAMVKCRVWREKIEAMKGKHSLATTKTSKVVNFGVTSD